MPGCRWDASRRSQERNPPGDESPSAPPPILVPVVLEVPLHLHLNRTARFIASQTNSENRQRENQEQDCTCEQFQQTTPAKRDDKCRRHSTDKRCWDDRE